MKNSIKLFSLLAIFAVTFVSCGKDDDADPDTNDNNNNANKEFAVTVDGTAWTNITTTAVKNTVGKIFIQAKMGDESVTLVMIDNVTPGSYNLSSSGNYTGTYKKTELADGEGALSGTLKVTKHDVANKKLEGTFDFTARIVTDPNAPTKAITGGTFNVTYTAQ